MILRNNLRSVDKKKDVSALICVMEFEHGIDGDKITTDKKWLSENAKLANTFVSIDELKLFYHDKPQNGRLTDRQRWRVMALVFEGMLLFLQVAQLISQIASGSSGVAIAMTGVCMGVIVVCMGILARQTIKDWGD